MSYSNNTNSGREFQNLQKLFQNKQKIRKKSPKCGVIEKNHYLCKQTNYKYDLKQNYKTRNKT